MIKSSWRIMESSIEQNRISFLREKGLRAFDVNCANVTKKTQILAFFDPFVRKIFYDFALGGPGGSPLSAKVCFFGKMIFR